MIYQPKSPQTQIARRSTRSAAALIAMVGSLVLAGSAAAAPAGSTFLVSRPDGSGPVLAPTDNSSRAPVAVSPEGRYVAFVSAADGFAPGANPRVMNVFVRDTVTNTTVLASRSDGVDGVGVNADVDAFGSAQIGITVEPGTRAVDGPHDRPHVFVAFSTAATNLVDHATHAVPRTEEFDQVWMRDVTAGTTYLVSRVFGSKGVPANDLAAEPSIAAGPNGPVVAFSSTATNLDTSVPDGTRRVYLREMTEGVTHLVSCFFQICGLRFGSSTEPVVQLVKGSSESKLCAAGLQCALVAFTTERLEVFGTEPRTSSQVVVSRAWEKADGTGLQEFDDAELGSAVWLAPMTPGNGPSREPSLSQDGLGVAFVSEATNLDPFGPALPPQPSEGYIHVGGGESTTLSTVTKDGSGRPVAVQGSVLHLSLAGPIGSWRLGFDTAASNLGTPAEQVTEPHAYEVLPAVEPVTLLDRGADGAIGDKAGLFPTISADGSTAVFTSRADNLGAGGGRDFERVYKRSIDPVSGDLGSLQLVSRPSGTGAFSPGAKVASIPHSAISADGRYVAFQSGADDLSSVDDDRLVNVFVRDTVNGTTTLVSRASGAGGAAADVSSQLDGISENGQRIVFSTGADNLGVSQPGPHVYVRDVAAQTTTLVSRVNGPSGIPARAETASISGDGNRVAFISASPLDPEAANGFSHLYVRDLTAQTTTFVDRDNGMFGPAAEGEPLDVSLDRDGDRVAWSTNAFFLDLPGFDLGLRHVRKIFLRDTAAGTTELVSRADGVDGQQADGDSLAPTIDAAGDVVAFESDGTNLGPVTQRSIWVRRVGSGRTELVSRATGANGIPADEPSFIPSIDAAGDRVAFVTHARTLGAISGEGSVPGSEAYVRDLGSKTTLLVSRVNGANGAPAEPAGFGGVSISANGDCVAFAGTGVNYGDYLASADFPAVRERVLRNGCGPVSVPEAGPSEPAPPPPPVQLSRLAMRPARFHVDGSASVARISFELSEPARVTLAFDRLVRDRAHHGLVRHRVGRLSVQGHAGGNVLQFSGRLRGRPLLPGRYRWTATPLHGLPHVGRFVVLPSRR